MSAAQQRWRSIVASASLLAVLATPPVLAQAGFPNVARTAGELLTPGPQGFSTDGRGAIIAFHGGLLYTVPEHPSSAAGSSFQIKVWDISTEQRVQAPLLVENLGIGPMNMQAHGYVLHDNRLQLGPDDWNFERTGYQQYARRQWQAGAQNIVWERGRLVPGWLFGQYSPGAAAQTIGGNWFYNLEDRHFAVGRRTVANDHRATELWASFDHLALSNGVMGMPLIFGDLLIIASEEVTLSGLAIYDLKPTYRNPGTPPTLLSVFKEGSSGGYWPELWGEGDRLYVFFPRRNESVRGWQVVDVSQPDAPALVADVGLTDWRDGLMYVQFQDNHAFSGRYKIDMHDPSRAVLTLPVDRGGFRADTSQFALPLGNLLVTGGLGTLESQAWRIWAHQAEPDNRGPTVGYHRPRPNQTQWPRQAPLAFLIHETLRAETIVNGSTVILRPLGGAVVDAHINFSSGQQLNLVPVAPLAADTEYEVVFPAGGIQDAAGNGIEAYSFRFSTGNSASGNQPPQVAAFDATPYPAAPGATVTFNASASDPDSGSSLEYRIVFGDGAVRDWSTQASATHSYAASGRYDALLQVRDPQGAIASRATRVTVMNVPVGPRPTASGPIAISADQATAWVANPDTDTVTRIALADGSATGEFAVGADPRTLALDGQGRLWVACHDADRIDLLDAASGVLLQSIATGYGSAPQGVAFSPDRSRAFVSLSGAGQLLRIDAATLAETRLALGPRPHALAVSSDGQRVLVTRFVSARFHGEVYDVDANTMSLTRTIALAMRTVSVETSADGRGVPNYLAGIAIEPGGARAWVSAKKDNVTRGLQFFDGRHELDPDNTVRAQLIPITLASGQQDSARVRDLDNSDSPTALAFSPHGDYLFVALQGNNQVAVLDVLRIGIDANQQGFGGRVATGLAPQGLAIAGSAAAPQLLVQDFLGRSLQRRELSTFLASGTGIGPGQTTPTVTTERLAPAVLRGKRLFYDASDPRMSNEGYISCASCHVDGGSDGRVWDFTGRGEGLRNNIDLRGRAGTGHGRVHWTANFDEIQDFEHDIRSFFGGLGFMSEADFAATSDPLGPTKAGRSAELDDLAAYVASLDEASLPKSPHRHVDGSRTDAATRGEQAFGALGCAACHIPAQGYRDGLRHDVGTLRATSGQRIGAVLDGIDTPTLLGVWANPPYLHDGAADTLGEVFASAAGTAYQAEAAQPDGALIQTQYIDLNDGNSSHGGYAAFGSSGNRLSFSGIDGGIGGVGRIEFRLALNRAPGFSFGTTVTINGQPRTMNIAATGAAVGWRTVAIEDVTLQPGSGNTIEITATSSSWPPLALDQLVVSTAADLQRAAPHRSVLQQSAATRDDLLAFLRELDGRNAAGESSADDRVFADGFEAR
jgi:DNA-binding beta-propeller fold protein YncE